MPMGKTPEEAFSEALGVPRRMIQVQPMDLGMAFLEPQGEDWEAELDRCSFQRVANATSLLKRFGCTFRLSCSEAGESGPVAYFAMEPAEQAILGVFGTRIYTQPGSW